MELRYNIGAGDKPIDGWNNLDMGDDIMLYKVFGVDVIYSSHFLEYFDDADAMDILKSWHSALKEGGTLMLAVPDWEAIISVYQQYGGVILKGPLFGKMNGIYHKTVYDYAGLRQVLLSAGFQSIRRLHTHVGERFEEAVVAHGNWPRIGDCATAKFEDTSISLNVICKK